MRYETKISYDERIINTAVRRYWIRKHLGDAIMSVMVLMVGSYFFLVENARNWFVGLLIGAALLYTGVVYGIFLSLRAQARKTFRALGSPDATWAFSDDAIFCESSEGKSEIKWSMVKKLWQFKDVWLLFYANGAYSTLPAQPLSDELKEFIERKVAEAGGEVR